MERKNWNIVYESEERGVLSSMTIEGHEREIMAFIEENDTGEGSFSVREL